METDPRMIEHTVFQDEDDFPLQIPINSQNDRVCFKVRKKDAPNKSFSHQTNRQSNVKVIVSAALTRFVVIKPRFVNKRRT